MSITVTLSKTTPKEMAKISTKILEEYQDDARNLGKHFILELAEQGVTIPENQEKEIALTMLQNIIMAMSLGYKIKELEEEK